MTFSYDLTATGDTLNIAKVRLELGDTTSGVGVRPDGTNFTNEELQIFLDREGDDVMRATAAACEALARAWSVVANITVGPRREDLAAVAEAWAKRAAQMRAQYGGVVSQSGAAFSAGVVRSDGYSADVASDNAADAETGEYGGVVRYVRL
jgi:hypothetical protein